MSGVRKDGILEVDNGGGGGTSVTIVDPIGPNLKADSVSVTLATDTGAIPVSSTPPANTSATGNLTALGTAVTIDVPDGYNSVLVRVGGVFNGNYIFLVRTSTSSAPSAVPGLLVDSNTWIFGDSYSGMDTRYMIPCMPGSKISIQCSIYTSGTLAVELIASPTQIVNPGLTTNDLQNLLPLSVQIPGTVTVTGTISLGGGSAQANQGSPAAIPSAWPIKITDGTDLASVVNEADVDLSARALLVAGMDKSASVAHFIPVLADNFTQPTTNTTAIPVDLRSAQQLVGNTPRNNTILVGGRSVDATAVTQQIFSNLQYDFSLVSSLANLWGATSRDWGQSAIQSNTLSVAGQRADIPNRFINFPAGLFKFFISGGFVGTIKPYISTDNLTTVTYVNCLNLLTGLVASSLTEANIDGVWAVLGAAGATNYGFELITKVSGGGTFVNYRISGNGGTSPNISVTKSLLGEEALVALAEDDELYTSGTTKPLSQTTEGFLRSLAGALVTDTPNAYLPGATKPLTLTSEGRLRVSSVESSNDAPWKNMNDNPWADNDENFSQVGW